MEPFKLVSLSFHLEKKKKMMKEDYLKLRLRFKIPLKIKILILGDKSKKEGERKPLRESHRI